MFPSEAYLALCKEHKKELREEWKKRGWKPDEWFYNPKHEEVHLLAHSRTHDIWFRDAPKRFARFLEHNIPLPSQRQLQVMLEERGWDWTLSNSIGAEGNSVVLSRCGGVIDSNDIMAKTGPDPETALLRCLAEVVKGATDN